MSVREITKCVQALLLLMWIASAPHVAIAGEAKIYLIRETDGSIRFTNKTPAAGEQAEVFTARANGGTYYRTGTAVREADGDIVYRSRASLRSSAVLPHKDGSRGALGRYADVIQQAARLHRVNPALVKAVIHAESAFNPSAVSPKGARGLMQLMPGTARMLGVRNAFSPESNIHGGTRYLAQLIRRFGNEALAVAAYNAGEVPVNRYNGIPPYSETQEYVKRVLQLKKQYTLRPNG